MDPVPLLFISGCRLEILNKCNSLFQHYKDIPFVSERFIFEHLSQIQFEISDPNGFKKCSLPSVDLVLSPSGHRFIYTII